MKETYLESFDVWLEHNPKVRKQRVELFVGNRWGRKSWVGVWGCEIFVKNEVMGGFIRGGGGSFLEPKKNYPNIVHRRRGTLPSAPGHCLDGWQFCQTRPGTLPSAPGPFFCNFLAFVDFSSRIWMDSLRSTLWLVSHLQSSSLVAPPSLTFHAKHAPEIAISTYKSLIILVSTLSHFSSKIYEINKYCSQN